MARQVYFDPFGSRLAGYRMGVQDETGVQDNARRARASDYDYQNFAPLRLAEAQRNDTLGIAAMPYQINAFGIRDRQNRANLAQDELATNAIIGQATGNYSPFLTRANDYGSGQDLAGDGTYGVRNRFNYDVLNQNNAGAMQVNPAIGSDYMINLLSSFGVTPQQFQQAMAMQTGAITPQMEQGADQFYGFDRALQIGDRQRLVNQDMWGRSTDQAAAQDRINQTYNTGQYNDVRAQEAMNRANGAYSRGYSPSGVLDEDGLE